MRYDVGTEVAILDIHTEDVEGNLDTINGVIAEVRKDNIYLVRFDLGNRRGAQTCHHDKLAPILQIVGSNIANR